MLQKLSTFAGVPGPVVIIVLDGYGIPRNDVGSAIAAARKPTLDALFAKHPHIRLMAHGTAVGMPSDDDMGNSEVGHNAIGAGQVYSQGASLVANAIAAGSIRCAPLGWKLSMTALCGGRCEKFCRPTP
jgi:2,3-bisphosphoglycerate-independent phosphoglycerate mutase